MNQVDLSAPAARVTYFQVTLMGGGVSTRLLQQTRCSLGLWGAQGLAGEEQQKRKEE